MITQFFFRIKQQRELFYKLSKTIAKNLHTTYDLGYWSKYEHSNTLIPMIASPFYHKLHIVQLEIMYKLTGENIFYEYSNKWLKYSSNIVYKIFAVVHKVFFKVIYY